MATTSNYSWNTPDDTSLVKDGASAIRTLGSSVDTTLFTINNGSARVGMHLITTATLTGASVTVTGAFSSAYDSYQIVISNLRTALPQDTNIRMGTTATGYYASQIISGLYSTATGTPSFSNLNNAASMTTGIVSSSTTAGTTGGIIFVQNPFLTTSTGIQCNGSDVQTNGQGRFVTGFHGAATSFTSFTLIAAGTTFSSGTVRVFGMRNS